MTSCSTGTATEFWLLVFASNIGSLRRSKQGTGANNRGALKHRGRDQRVAPDGRHGLTSTRIPDTQNDLGDGLYRASVCSGGTSSSSSLDHLRRFQFDAIDHPFGGAEELPVGDEGRPSQFLIHGFQEVIEPHVELNALDGHAGMNLRPFPQARDALVSQ